MEKKKKNNDTSFSIFILLKDKFKDWWYDRSNNWWDLKIKIWGISNKNQANWNCK
jgi:hypothetical protein